MIPYHKCGARPCGSQATFECTNVKDKAEKRKVYRCALHTCPQCKRMKER